MVRRRPDRVAQRRVDPRQCVDLADDRLPAPRHDDRRSRRDAVVAPDRRLQARQDVGGRRLLGDGVEIRVGGRPHRREDRRDRQRHRERRGQPTRGDAVLERELGPRDALGGQQQGGAAEGPELQKLAAAQLHGSLPARTARRVGSDRGCHTNI